MKFSYTKNTESVSLYLFSRGGGGGGGGVRWELEKVIFYKESKSKKTGLDKSIVWVPGTS